MIAGPAAILLLLGLSGVHFYWAAGGRLGKDAAIPTLNGAPVIRPSAIGTAAIALGLMVMAIALCMRIGWLSVPDVPLADDFVRFGAWLITAVFAARAVGDFRYVGFFKRVRGSRFARLDTLAYSPFCAALAILVAITAVA